ncbi:hypothetical protein G6011_11562 [Alternaria panax]|uniref:Heterokaryon incompatibility domain-containing protein n=1 Tax=Alternaria panax TaxID=48097 RepID=A0AAD4IDT6_9PLEO|nr:hypothetical protein G6011_11562 [Alternaria panax]
MRLLNARTYELKTFFTNIPPYAILSHCWDDEEVTFSDLADLEQAKEKKGFAKIQKTCELAVAGGFDYAWVDTCCIDKSSSAELLEAINSMFAWYKDCGQCYAYLADVELEDTFVNSNSLYTSKWFTRAWTLQELLAPKITNWVTDGSMRFYSRDWQLIGTKITLAEILSDITGVPIEYLEGQKLEMASISMRMSWAAGRQATRAEDIAYSLLGMFDVNMPLLYGEGKSKAFRRLQEEIMKSSEDETLFAWESAVHDPTKHATHVLANDPDKFTGSSKLVPFESETPATPYTMTHRGLRIRLPLFKAQQLKRHDRLSIYSLRSGKRLSSGSDVTWGILRCHVVDDFHHIVVIPLRCLFANVYVREESFEVSVVREAALPDALLTQEIYVRTAGSAAVSASSRRRRFGFLIRKLPVNSYISNCTPAEAWNSRDKILQGKRENLVVSSWQAYLDLTFFSPVSEESQRANRVIHLELGCDPREHNGVIEKPSPWYSFSRMGTRKSYADAMEEYMVARGSESVDDFFLTDLDLKVRITPRKVLLQDMFVVDIETAESAETARSRASTDSKLAHIFQAVSKSRRSV